MGWIQGNGLQARLIMTKMTTVFVPEHNLTNTKTGEVVNICKDTTVGRKDSDIILKDSKVSGHHCIFEPMSISLSLRDLGSTNGTYVNQMKVPSEGLILKSGDKIRIGGTVFIYGDMTEEKGADFFSMELGAKFIALLNQSYLRWSGYFIGSVVIIFWISSYPDLKSIPPELEFLKQYSEPPFSLLSISILTVLHMSAFMFGHAYFCKVLVKWRRIPQKLFRILSLVAILVGVSISSVLITQMSKPRLTAISTYSSTRTHLMNAKEKEIITVGKRYVKSYIKIIAFIDPSDKAALRKAHESGLQAITKTQANGDQRFYQETENIIELGLKNKHKGNI